MVFNKAKRQAYIQLMRLDKPIGIYLLMWPTLWALFLVAEGRPPLSILFIFLAGVVLMRSAGCVINDYADRNVDGKVERTKNRPLAKGIVSAKEALVLFGVLVGLSFALVLMLNMQTIYMSFGALALAACYPFMKRYTHFPQVVLGAAFGWSIPMASTALIGHVPYWVWILFAANLAWTVAYDTLYAMVDRDDDLKIGVKSTAIAFGTYDLLIVGGLQVLTIGLLVWVFQIKLLSQWAYVVLLLAALGFSLILKQCRERDKNALFDGFLKNHYIGAIIWLSIVVGLP
jgi:4-hydroxybenzoate polyprenyltransferase